MFEYLRQLFAGKPPVAPDENAMVDFYGQFLAPGDLCFDVGANVGNRLTVFRRIGCRVVALEPQTSCFQTLQERYGSDSAVTLLPQAVAASESTFEMLVCDASTISSLSPDWVQAVKESGRFKEYSWEKQETVQSTTLDRLIAAHGLPRFIKIDVEGFESEVVAGLTQPVPCLSFEWVPEFSQGMRVCLAHLESLGRIEAAYSLGESMKFAGAGWTTADEVRSDLQWLEGDPRLFGDVYVRFPEAPPRTPAEPLVP